MKHLGGVPANLVPNLTAINQAFLALIGIHLCCCRGLLKIVLGRHTAEQISQRGNGLNILGCALSVFASRVMHRSRVDAVLHQLQRHGNLGRNVAITQCGVVQRGPNVLLVDVQLDFKIVQAHQIVMRHRALRIVFASAADLLAHIHMLALVRSFFALGLILCRRLGWLGVLGLSHGRLALRGHLGIDHLLPEQARTQQGIEHLFLGVNPYFFCTQGQPLIDAVVDGVELAQAPFAPVAALECRLCVTKNLIGQIGVAFRQSMPLCENAHSTPNHVWRFIGKQLGVCYPSAQSRQRFAELVLVGRSLTEEIDHQRMRVNIGPHPKRPLRRNGAAQVGHCPQVAQGNHLALPCHHDRNGSRVPLTVILPFLEPIGLSRRLAHVVRDQRVIPVTQHVCLDGERYRNCLVPALAVQAKASISQGLGYGNRLLPLSPRILIRHPHTNGVIHHSPAQTLPTRLVPLEILVWRQNLLNRHIHHVIHRKPRHNGLQLGQFDAVAHRLGHVCGVLRPMLIEVIARARGLPRCLHFTETEIRQPSIKACRGESFFHRGVNGLGKNALRCPISRMPHLKPQHRARTRIGLRQDVEFGAKAGQIKPLHLRALSRSQ